MRKVTVSLNKVESRMLDDLVACGIFGDSEWDVLRRILDERLHAFAKEGIFTSLPPRPGREYFEARTLADGVSQ